MKKLILDNTRIIFYLTQFVLKLFFLEFFRHFMIKPFSKDDILVSPHNVTHFFLQIGLNFSEDPHLFSQPLNISLIIEETLSKHSRKNQKFGKMLHKSHSLDTQLSSQKVLMNSGFFLKHLFHLHSNVFFFHFFLNFTFF